MTHDNASSIQISMAGALRQIFNQLLRILESSDPGALIRDPSTLERAVESWRRTLADKTSGASVQRARELENAKLELMGEVAKGKKAIDDLTERNKDLLAQIVRLNKREAEHKQKLLEAQFAASGAKGEVKKLDLEIRDLRRKVRDLEGGPPLTAEEAAPQSLQEPDEAQEGSGQKQQAPEAEEEKPISLAEAIAQHQSERGSSDARSAAEQAFQALFKGAEEQEQQDEPAPQEQHQAREAAPPLLAAVPDLVEDQPDDQLAEVIDLAAARANHETETKEQPSVLEQKPMRKNAARGCEQKAVDKESCRPNCGQESHEEVCTARACN
jgi:chromosome segregation ATPase